MKRLILLASSLALLLLFAAPAAAQEYAQRLQVELTSSIAEISQIDKAMMQLESANANMYKEEKLYVDDMKEKKARMERDKENFKNNVITPKINAYKTIEADFNNQCGGQLTKSQYDGCVIKKADVHAKYNEVQAWLTKTQDEWNAKNVDPFNAVIKKQLDRIGQLNREIEKNVAAHTQYQQRSQTLRNRVAEIEGIFRKACGGSPGEGSPFTSAEALKWCHSVNWDGASRNLPPMYQDQGRGSITPIGPAD